MPVASLHIDHRIPYPARRLESLVQQLLKLGKNHAQMAIREGCVRVNGQIIKRPQVMLEEGDKLVVEYEPPKPPPPAPKANLRQQVEILYEDDAIVVINKPPALLTVPTPKQESRTVISELTKMLQRNHPRAQACCVHRLDRGVSGLLVFAKNVEIAEVMRDQFAERKPARLYLAIIDGHMKTSEGTFRSYLATDEDLNRYSTDIEEEGQLAITHYRTLETLPDTTLVEVRLETGRRNQIRVHFAEAGHPILGDERYGKNLPYRPLWPHRRLALHALTLGIKHPVSGEELQFRSKIPPEFRTFLESPNKKRRP